MKQHPRVAIVDTADREHERAFADIMARHGLTLAEAFLLLARTQMTLCRSMLRIERHPGEPDKPSDEE